MVKCKCGQEFVKGCEKCPWCGMEIINFEPTTEEAMHDKLYQEYFAAFKEQEDTSVMTPIILMVIGGITAIFLIGIPIFIIGAYMFIVNLFSKGAKQSKLDRARDRLERYEEKHG